MWTRVPSAISGASPLRRGDVELIRPWRAQHQRAALRPHVVAAESEQPVGELARIARRRVEREHALDEIERARLLPERLAAAMQLDVRLLELPDRGAHLLLHRLGAPIRAARIFLRLRVLRLEHDHALGSERPAAARRVARDGERLLERREMLHVLAVHALRDILERAHRFVARLALGKARVGELEQRDVRREALHHARAEEAARLVHGDDGGELSVDAHAAKREQPFLFERGVETEQSRVLVATARPRSTNCPPARICVRMRAGRWSTVVSARARSTFDPSGLTRSRSIWWRAS